MFHPATRLLNSLDLVLRHERVLLATIFVVVMAGSWGWIIAMSRDMYGPMTGWSSWMMAGTWDVPHLLLLWAILLIVAGVYQMTPLKRVCLSACRSPLSFLMGNWRSGTRGAFQLGARHGAYCLGLCWALMLLLFAGGVMNLLVIGALTALFQSKSYRIQLVFLSSRESGPAFAWTLPCPQSPRPGRSS